MPEISAVIPIYHPKREYIDRLMDSIVRQTIGMEKIEAILVSDGDQTEETKAILSSWEEKYPENIMVIYYEENRRPGYARTLGMEYAQGKYIAFADQDDWLSLEMYRVLAEKAEETGAEIAGGFSTRDREYVRPEVERKFTGEEDVLWEIRDSDTRKRFLIEGEIGGYWCSIYRRDFLEEHQIYFPAGVTYDDNFFAMVCRFCAKRVLVLGEYFYHWFVNEQSISMAEDGDTHFDRLKVEELILSELKERNMYEELEKEIEITFLEKYYFNTMHIFFSHLSTVPYQTYLEMCRRVWEEFPSYRENPYLSQEITSPLYPSMLTLCQSSGGADSIQLLSQVPERMRHFSWIDSLAGDMTEEELMWLKCIYLMQFLFL